MSKQFIERRIAIGLITNEKYLREISPVFDQDLLKDEAAKKIASWCIRHWNKHSKPPLENIGIIYESYVRRGKLRQDEADDIGDILDGLSGEYQEQSENNPDVLIDETFAYFDENRLIRLADEVKLEAERGNLLEANSLIAKNRQIQRTAGVDHNFFADDINRTQKIFENVQEPIIEYPGKLGYLLNRHFVRGGFVGLLGPEKTGKTWWLADIGFQAQKSGKKVAFFAAGDMNREEMELRKYIYMARKSNESEYCGRLLIPVLDCFWNQNGNCAAGPGGMSPIRGDKPPAIKDLQKMYSEAFEEYGEEHEPCTKCLGKKEFLGAPWFKIREKVDPLTWKEAYNIERKFQKRFRNAGWNFADYPAYTLTCRMIDNQLAIWHENGFTADVVLIDYPDIMGPDDEDRKLDFRQKENMKWLKLRALAHKWHCLVVCPTQADGASYGKDWLDLSNYSEDKRKYSHTTAFFGLNQTDGEAELGIFRINQLIVRSGKRGKNYATILQRLETGRPFLNSY